MSQNGTSNLRPREIRVLRALLEEPTLEAAAKAAKTSRRTLHRLLQREDFRREFNDARRDLLRTSLGRLQAATGDAAG